MAWNTGQSRVFLRFRSLWSLSLDSYVRLLNLWQILILFFFIYFMSFNQKTLFMLFLFFRSKCYRSRNTITYLPITSRHTYFLLKLIRFLTIEWFKFFYVFWVSNSARIRLHVDEPHRGSMKTSKLNVNIICTNTIKN